MCVRKRSGKVQKKLTDVVNFLKQIRCRGSEHDLGELELYLVCLKFGFIYLLCNSFITFDIMLLFHCSYLFIYLFVMYVYFAR